MTASTDSVVNGMPVVAVAAGESLNRSIVIGKEEPTDCFLHVVMAADSHLDLSVIVLPGASSRVNLQVDMEGPGAEAYISGIYLCPGDERVSIRTDVNHKVHHCVSRQLFKGIAGGTAKTDFYGKIVVAQDAQKTEAYQENHNLLISDAARMDTRPQLEIYADDVKCSHGATVGRLNEEEQFYMRSRGIPEREAMVLQMLSFISPVISHIPDLQTRENVSAIAEKAIRNIGMSE
jgi:Fe-S cluster assembly protein SufD